MREGSSPQGCCSPQLSTCDGNFDFQPFLDTLSCLHRVAGRCVRLPIIQTGARDRGWYRPPALALYRSMIDVFVVRYDVKLFERQKKQLGRMLSSALLSAQVWASIRNAKM